MKKVRRSTHGEPMTRSITFISVRAFSKDFAGKTACVRLLIMTKPLRISGIPQRHDACKRQGYLR